jgi:hypothetical protein
LPLAPQKPAKEDLQKPEAEEAVTGSTVMWEAPAGGPFHSVNGTTIVSAACRRPGSLSE